MAPIFTGSRFGFGRSDAGDPLAGPFPPRVEVLFSQFSTTYYDPSVPQNYTSSPTKTLDVSIKYLYVIGSGAGGPGLGGGGGDNGGPGGGAAAAIVRMTGYEIPNSYRANPIQVQTGLGGRWSQPSGNTTLLLGGNSVLVLGAGVNRPGGAVTTSGITRLPAFPSNNEATGGAGGTAALRESSAATNGFSSPSPLGGNAGGGGGGAHVTPKAAGAGGNSTPVGPVSYNVITTIGSPYPIVITGTSGGAAGSGDGGGLIPVPQSGGTVGLARGGRGTGIDGNTGSSGGAGAGIRAVTPNSPSPATYFGGGGGALRNWGTTGSNIPPYDNAQGEGGSGFIIVIGSSYELVAGVDY